MTTSFRAIPSEVNLYITADGVSYYLDVPKKRYVVSEEGTGMPPIDYIAQRGPYQQGESLRDFFLKPRTVQLIVRHNYCSRQDYWQGRAELIDILRMNRNAQGTICQGTLRKIEEDGTTRDLTCLIEQGPAFSPRDRQQWDEWAYTETLRFTAFDPTYFDPKAQSASFQLVDVATFPMTFPVTFVGFLFSTSIVYGGNWLTYPTITVAGPFNTLTITNTTTGKYISLAYALATGRTLTLSLGYGNKTVTLDDGTNLIGYVVAGSNLVDFALVPGTNVITVSGSGTGASTIVTLTWNNRYLGI